MRASTHTAVTLDGVDLVVFNLDNGRFRWSADGESLSYIDVSGVVLSRVEIDRRFSDREAALRCCDAALDATVTREGRTGAVALYNPRTREIAYRSLPQTEAFRAPHFQWPEGVSSLAGRLSDDGIDLVVGETSVTFSPVQTRTFAELTRLVGGL